MSKQVKQISVQHLSTIQVSESHSWRCEKILPKSGIVFIYGASGVGKSFFAIHTGLAIASGIDVAGQKTSKCGVIYCAAEAGESIKSRVLAAKEAFGSTEETEFSLITDVPNLGESESGTNDLIAAIKADEEKSGWQYRVIIIDTLARATPGLDENSSKDAGKFIQNAEEISKQLDALVLIVHHPGKVANMGMRGSSAFFAAAETVIQIAPREGYTWVQIEKQREGADNLGFSFKLKAFGLGNSQDGEAIMTCVVGEVSHLQPADQTSAGNGKLSVKNRQWLESLKAFLLERGTDVTLQDGQRVQAVSKTEFIEHYQASEQGKKETLQKQFYRGYKMAGSMNLLGTEKCSGREMIWLVKTPD